MDKNKQQIRLIPTRHPHVFNVQLNLEHQTRYIGQLNLSGEGTYLTTRKDKHLFRKTQSLGINYALLSNEEIKFKRISISFNGKKLCSTREYFLKKGKAFQFSNKSFDLQIFVPIDELNINAVKRFEQTTGRQESLFSGTAA